MTITELRPEGTAVGDALQSFLEEKRAMGVSERTLGNYQWLLKRFVSACPRVNVQDITTEDVRDFQVWLQDRFKPQTVKSYRIAMDAFFNFLVGEETLTTNPCKKVKKPKLPKELKTPLSDEQSKRVIDSLSGKSIFKVRDRAIVYLMLDSGLRLEECSELSCQDVDAKRGIVVVRGGKGDKDRFVFMGQSSMKAMTEWYNRREGEGKDPLWLGEKGPLTSSGVAQIIKRISKKSGVKFSAHDLRRTFAINSLKNGADLLSVSRQLGHSDVSTTQIYVNQTCDDLKAVHSKSSPLDRLKVQTLGGLRQES